jgi:hypothetical protein
MGFAYYPDGDHDGKPELEPTVAWDSDQVSAQQDGNSSAANPCVATATCPTPMYYDGSTFLGNASDLARSFGLDEYESMFGHPIGEWNAQNFSVRLNFDDDTYGQDIFYFCHVRVRGARRCLDSCGSCLVFVVGDGPATSHTELMHRPTLINVFPLRYLLCLVLKIHQYMSGRIKLLRDGTPISISDEPPILYEYDAPPGEFDAECGTYGLEPYQLPNPQCPSHFVCIKDYEPEQDDAMRQSAKCYDAFDCAMMAGMTTGASSGSEVGLFIHQYVTVVRHTQHPRRASVTDLCILKRSLLSRFVAA